MFPPNKLSGLCLIIDQDVLRTEPEQAMQQALSAGVTFFQYRNKQGTRKAIYEISLQLVRLARTAGALFVVNDHTDIAAAVDADGVHLGQDDLPLVCARKLLGSKKIIGISTHTVEQAREAEAAGADYIGFGAVFATPTKEEAVAHGLELLSAVKKAVSIPVVAIGGINQQNIRKIMEAGADGAAVISAVLSAPSIKQAAEELIHDIHETGTGSRMTGGVS